MPWGRIILAAVLSAFLLIGYGGLLAAGSGAINIDGVSAPGIAGDDTALLAQPYKLLRASDDATLIGRMSPDVDKAAARTQLPLMRASLPPRGKVTSRLMRWTRTAGTGPDTLSGIHEHKYADHIVIATTTLSRTSDAEPWRVLSMNVNTFTKQQVEANRFTLAGKSPGFIAFVAVCAVMPLFVFAMTMSALFKTGLNRRWLWVLFILLGFVTFSMDGATGAIAVQPLSFLLFSASALWSGSPVDPWRLSIAIPAGALAYALLKFGRRVPVIADGETAA